MWPPPRPQRRLEPTGAGMDRNYRAQPIVFAPEHHLQFLALDLRARLAKGRFSLVRRLGIVGAFFLGHRKEQPRLIERRAQPLETRELFVYAVVFLERGLGGFLPVPEARLAGLFQQLFVAGLEGSAVKDASRVFWFGFRSRLPARAFRSVPCVRLTPCGRPL